MKNNIPFVHLFNVSENHYMFDVNTDSILKITESTSKKVNDLFDKSKHGEVENSEDLLKLRENGYLKSNRVEKTLHPSTKLLPTILRSKINFLVLQVTQGCNLRCSYCIYSGLYDTRQHSKKKMSFDTAKKAMDYLITHSTDSPDLKVGFYGGEPLLEFELIKKCVDYMETMGANKPRVYNITTNGTCLTSNVMDFFVKHNFRVTISLDGPENVHDRSRRFVDSDKGSFRLIKRNLEKFKERHPQYYSQNVGFNTVLTSKDSYFEISDYFNSEDVFSNSEFSCNFVSDAQSKDAININDQFLQEYYYEYFKMLLSKVGRVGEKNVSVIIKQEFTNIWQTRTGKQNFKREKLPSISHHAGPCIPGEKSLFVTADEKLFPCERVSENSEYCSLGSLDSGVDVNKAEKMLNVETGMEKHCHNCWAYEYCGMCCRFSTSQADITKQIQMRCSGMRTGVENLFKDYCVLRELGFDFEVNHN
ncbi:Cys-rich peptide radical SAM maturase CcpM [Enterococcus florum]|uniref:Cys-rich peptide radical SAM maturase CcpM n=1 Tax=Enterococcus florum TaxID=2480627 RepID=A0A4P5P9A6_9ENTE|nr:Cys-rich peptide radical SAM maturase CcpM [Enterococcus florum]GCF94647.1 Cys-rich peptide radical SAM maturase CcpM [Enterococcus florum]